MTATAETAEPAPIEEVQAPIAEPATVIDALVEPIEAAETDVPAERTAALSEQIVQIETVQPVEPPVAEVAGSPVEAAAQPEPIAEEPAAVEAVLEAEVTAAEPEIAPQSEPVAAEEPQPVASPAEPPKPAAPRFIQVETRSNPFESDKAEEERKS